MSDNVPSIGIDFGATNSSMAWFDLRTGQAEVILNAEGEVKASSPVYFSQGETLVGKLVGYRISIHSLRDPSRMNGHRHPKRPPQIAQPLTIRTGRSSAGNNPRTVAR